MTAGGSSGAPLYTPQGRFIGQLSAGQSICGLPINDFYGRLAAQWSLVEPYLDPFGTGALTLDGLDPALYRTDFRVEGSCNYAFTLVLRDPDDALRDRVMETLRACGVEFRRGTSGGGNQLRQPYLKKLLGEEAWRGYPNVDHVHFYGFYIGNYPDLERSKIGELCAVLNGLRQS